MGETSTLRKDRGKESRVGPNAVNLSIGVANVGKKSSLLKKESSELLRVSLAGVFGYNIQSQKVAKLGYVRW